MDIKSLDFEHIKATEMNRKRKIDTKIDNTVDITKDIRVLSIDMSTIYKYCYSGYSYKDYVDLEREIEFIKQTDSPSKNFPYIKRGKNEYLLNKSFSCKVPYSLCLDFIYSQCPLEFSYDTYGNQYTDLIIDVTCKDSYKELSIKNGKVSSNVNVKVTKNGNINTSVKDKLITIISKKELRKFIYRNGFIVNGEKYVYYKRSSSKARRGSVLYIKESFKKTFELWSRQGIEFGEGEEVDPKLSLAGILAYESLDMSHVLPSYIHIRPEQILLIDDIKANSLKNNMYVNRLLDGQIHTSIEEIVETNTVTDGQSLLDESIFNKYGYKDKGCCLLRQKMTKSCAFNTKLVKFLKWHYGNEYETKVIEDLVGRDIKVSDIRWIVTPSSFKFFKFESKYIGGKAEAYQVWIDNLQSEKCKFGVCKNEQKSQFGEYQQISYQILQALVLNKDAIKELVQDHLDYYRQLWNNDIVFNYFKKDLTFKKSNDFIDNLCAYTNDAEKTIIYRKKKNKCLESYRKKMRIGKILVKDTDYSIVVSDPITMLYSAVGIENHFIAEGYEIYCNRYNNGQMLFETRNPVVCSANIGYVENKWHDEYKWLNLTENIAIITGNKNNFYTKNSGLDMDSDAILISSHPILVKQAEWCHNNFLIPHSEIGQTEEDEKKKQYYTMDYIAMTDTIISDNYIGKITNFSQLLNSLWQDKYYQYMSEKDGNEQKKIKSVMDEIMMDIAKCNDLSNVEIDKAKKPLSANSKFELIKIMQKNYILKATKKIKKQKINVKTYNDLMKLKTRMEETTDENDILILNEELDELLNEEINSIIKPKFFRYITKIQPKFEYISMNCTMDYLQEILDEEFKKYYRRESYIPISDIFGISDTNIDKSDRRHMKKIFGFAADCDARLKWYNRLKKSEQKNIITKNELVDCFSVMIKSTVKNPTITTLKTIIIKCFEDDKSKKYYSGEYVKVRNTMCMLLFNAYGDKFLECFRSTGNGKVNTLQRITNNEDDYDIIVLGEKYKYSTRDVICDNIDLLFKQKMFELKCKTV